MTRPLGSLLLAGALALTLPTSARADEPLRLTEPMGLHAREERTLRLAPELLAPAPLTSPAPRPTPAEPVVETTPRRRRRPPPPCLSPPTELVRVDGQKKETARVSLTFCDGRPVPTALDVLSVLGRPHGMAAPSERALRAYARRVARRPRRGETPADPAYVADGVLRLEPGLVPRIARIAARFAGKPIELISGWRPNERLGSRHHYGRAIDLRVRGVSREALRDFARSLDETGVGYYPNSVFVHVDVRERRAYWVDRSGPGEEADYGSWPPPTEEQLRTRDRIVTDAVAALDALRVEVPTPDAPPAPAEQAPPEPSQPSTATQEDANGAPDPASHGQA